MAKFREVTANEVRAAIEASGRTWFPLHDCSLCCSEVGYSAQGDEVLFHPACDCSYAPPEPRSYSDIADSINMQTERKHRVAVAARFGLDLSEEAP